MDRLEPRGLLELTLHLDKDVVGFALIMYKWITYAIKRVRISIFSYLSSEIRSIVSLIWKMLCSAFLHIAIPSFGATLNEAFCIPYRVDGARFCIITSGSILILSPLFRTCYGSLYDPLDGRLVRTRVSVYRGSAA